MMRRRVAVVLVVLALLATPILLQFAGVWGPQEDTIVVDGDIGDWEDVMSYSDMRADADGAGEMDITNWAVYREHEYLAARAKLSLPFAGMTHQGADGDGALHLFIDEDAEAGTGYSVADLGADRMVQVTITHRGASRGNVYIWDPDHRTEAPYVRGPDDWNGWAPAPGSVEVSIGGKNLEMKARPDPAIPREALYLMCTVDAFGRGDVTDVSVDGTGPVLLVHQAPSGPDIVPAGTTGVLELSMEAYGGDVRLTGLTFSGGDGDPHFEDKLIDRLLQEGEPFTTTIGIDVDAGSSGDVVSLGTGEEGGWTSETGRILLTGRPYIGHALQAPERVTIDGAFADWDLEGNATVRDRARDVARHPEGPPEVTGMDLSVVSAEVSADLVALYVEVEDGMMAGTLVPHLPGSTPVGALDIDGDGRLDLDGDGMEDGHGTSDRDWDNDYGQPDDPGTTFADTGLDDEDEDDDNDGVPDWHDPARGGPHVPGPPSSLPPLLGTDVVEFLIDTDGDGGTGYSPDGYQLGADRRVLIEGRNGVVRTALVKAHNGETVHSWSWDEGVEVDHAMDGTRLEVGVDPSDLAMGADPRLLVRAVGWAGTKDWSDNLLEGTGNATEPLKVGSAVGAIDPFTVTTAGGFSISPDGATWTQEDGPTDNGAAVDVAAGQGAQAGYVYLLTGKGKVMVSSRATEGWTEYGQGLPGLPASHGYVGIATGKGALCGYVYVLRNDGKVYVCDRATNGWTRYGQGGPAIPSATSYVDLATGGEGLEGYVYVLRADGAVHVADSAVTGWTRYGQGEPALPSTDPEHVAVATGDGTTRGSVYIMSRTGKVYVATSATTGWSRYGQGAPALTDSEGFIAMDAGTPSQPGRVVVMRHDGSTYVADSAVTGWTRYGQGTPTLPSGQGYSGIALGDHPLAGYVYLSSEEGMAYVTTSAVSGWTQYGQGTPVLPRPGGHSSITGDGGRVFILSLNGTVHASNDDGASWSTFGSVSSSGSGWVSICMAYGGDLFVLRRDGSVRTSSSSSSSWSDHGDAGTGGSWVAMAVDDDGNLYALRSDGTVNRASTSSTTWSSKGDAGDGNAWVDLAATDGDDHVYALRADRAISRSTAGTSTTWSSWASADGGGSWVAVATDGTYVWTLRNDGRVDRGTVAVTPSWSTAHGDAGTDSGWEDIAVPIPEFPSLMLQALLTMVLIHVVRWRVSQRRSRTDDDDDIHDDLEVK
jgi:hypothetical protein